MNETSRGGTGRGCGDPPIGGYPPSVTPTSSGSGGTPTSSANTTSTTSGTSGNEDPGLPSLGATLGSEFDSFGESLNLTRLLAGDTGSWDFSDPLSAANAAANQANQGSYRPWEIDLPPATTSSLLTLSTMSRGPPNVLAPPSTTSTLLSRPHIATGHHGPMAQHQYAYYQPHPSHLPSHHQHHSHLIDQRLPSFQSQFQESHHQVGAHYPLVPPPVQAREIPNLQQQFLDERHIQTSQLSAAWPHSHFAAAARLHQIGGNQGSNSVRGGRKTSSQQQPQQHGHHGQHQQQQQQQHHGQQQHHQQQQQHHQTDLTLLGDNQRPSSVSSLNSSSSLTQVEASHPTLAAQLRKKTNRTGSLEGSESDQSADTPGQVAAISSTDQAFKSPSNLTRILLTPPPSGHGVGNGNSNGKTGNGLGSQQPTPSMGLDHDKSNKKKRKRCGECLGCQKKDNCGQCAPCRNDKSHQICKVRRCERLTEKKPRKGKKGGNGTSEARSGVSESTPVSKPGRKSTKQTQKQLQQQQQQQQQQISTPSATPVIQAAQVNTMFSQYGASASQPQTATSASVGGTTWGNNPMVADPWQNHYHQSMAGPTSAFGAVAVAGPQFTSGFGQPYGYAHRPGSLNGRQGFDILPSPTMSGPPPPAGPGAAFVGLNVAMSPRGAATSVQGNFQPGYPHRPTEESLLSSSNATSEGHSGHHNRTDTSPDTTTKDLSPPLHLPPLSSSSAYQHLVDHNTANNANSSIYQPSFLAYSAGEVPLTTRSSGPSEGSHTNKEAFAMPLQSVRSGSLAGSSPAPNQQTNSMQVESRRQEQMINQDVTTNQENNQEKEEKFSSQPLQENNNSAINGSPKKRGRPRKDPNATPSPPKKRQPKKVLDLFQNSESLPDSTTTKDGKAFQFDQQNNQFVISLPPMNSFPNCSWNFESQSMSPWARTATKMIPNISSGPDLQGWQVPHLYQTLAANQSQTQLPVKTETNEKVYFRNEPKTNSTTTSQQFNDALKQQINQVHNCSNVKQISSQNNPEIYNVLPNKEPKNEAPDVHERTSYKVEPEESNFQQDPNQKLEVKVEKREPLNPLENLKLESLRRNDKEVPPDCACFQDHNRRREIDTGPYYTQLGYSNSLDDLRRQMEKRTGATGKALRIEEAVFCPREGKSAGGCPIAKQIVRRSSLEEKFLVIVKQRVGHFCTKIWLVIAILSWDGVQRQKADYLYDKLKSVIPEYGVPTERQCEMNSSKTCACQGNDIKKEGASYSFGCAWNVYHDGCKFAKSPTGYTRRFKLTKESEEEDLEYHMDDLADDMGLLLEQVAPDAFANLTAFSEEAKFCRIGKRPKKDCPFSGVTSVLDFCAHSHHDRNNMNGGCTVVVTLTKPEIREFGCVRSDEQLHVLPNYRVVKKSNLYSSQDEEVCSTGVQILNEFRRVYGTRKAARKKRKCAKNNKSFNRPWSRPFNPKNEKLDREPMVPKMPKLIRLPKAKKIKDGLQKLTQLKNPDFSSRMMPQSCPPVPTINSQRYPEYEHLVKWNHAQPKQGSIPNNSNHYQSTVARSTHSQLPASVAHQSYSAMMTMKPQNLGYPASYGNPVQPNLYSNFSYTHQQQQQQQYLGSRQSFPQQYHDSTFYQMGPFSSQQQRCFISNPQPTTTAEISGQNKLPSFEGFFRRNDSASHIPQLDGVDDFDSDFSQHLTSVSKNNNLNQFYQTNFEDSLARASTSGSMISNALNNIGYSQQQLKSNDYYPSMIGQYETIVTEPSETTSQPPAMTPNNTNFLPPTPVSLIDSPRQSHTGYPLSTSDELEEPVKEEDVITYQEVTNREVFGERNVDIGGLAIALEHGSVLIECAKHEMHATTALRNPDRFNPTRIGLVFYQHKRLTFERHGYFMLKQKAKEKMSRDYQNHLAGKFVPTENQLIKMTEAGFQFPDKVIVSKTKKPRGNNGHEEPDDLNDPERSYYTIDNPAKRSISFSSTGKIEPEEKSGLLEACLQSTPNVKYPHASEFKSDQIPSEISKSQTYYNNQEKFHHQPSHRQFNAGLNFPSNESLLQQKSVGLANQNNFTH